MTIEDGKQYLRENFDKGVTCPCCGQFVKRYLRTIHTTMARMLINLYQLTIKDWDKFKISTSYYHDSQIMRAITVTGTNDFAKLRYWKLIEEMPKDPKDSSRRTSGYWRITDTGIDFVLERSSVPKYAHIYNSKFHGFSGQLISISQALGKKFNYQELMHQ